MTTQKERIEELERKLALLSESNTPKTEAKTELSKFTKDEKNGLETIINGLPNDAVVYSCISLVLGRKTYTKALNEKIADVAHIEKKLKEAGISGKLNAVTMPLSFSHYFD